MSRRNRRRKPFQRPVAPLSGVATAETPSRAAGRATGELRPSEGGLEALASCPECGCLVWMLRLPDGRACWDPSPTVRRLVGRVLGVDPVRLFGQCWGPGLDAPHECPPLELTAGGWGRCWAEGPDPESDPEGYVTWLWEDGYITWSWEGGGS